MDRSKLMTQFHLFFCHEMINRKYLKHLVRRRMYVMFVQKHSLSHSNWGYINVCILGNVLTRAGNFIPQFFFKTYIIEMPFTIRKSRNLKCKKFLNHIHLHSCKDIARKPFIGEIIGKSTSRVISIKKLRWDEYWVDRRPVILVWIDSFVQPFATL